MKIKFDDPTVRNLKPAESAYDCMAKGETGFGIRVHPTGTMTFFFQYKIAGQRRFLSLGNYHDTKLKDARSAYEAERVKVKALRRGSADGVDPVLQKKLRAETLAKEETKRRQACTFDELAKDYIADNVEGQVVDRSLYDIKRVLLGNGKDGSIDDFKGLRNRTAASITFEDVSKLLKKVAGRSAASARNLIKSARPMFAYAVARKITPINPFEMHKVNTFLPKAVKSNLKATVKNRTLDDAEIKTLWKALSGQAVGGDKAKDALRLLLLLGQRPTEVLGMNSHEISGNWWTLPKERTKARLDKQRRDHVVFLVSEALTMLGDKKGFIFESRNKSSEGVKEHISVNALGNMIRKNKYFGLAPWGAHDLRRTVRTYMSDIDGISAKAAEAVLNHAAEGTKKNYDHHKYQRQIENALTLWRDRLVEIIGEPLVKSLPGNVISIDKARKAA